jgi:hypothetical protein
MVRNQDPDNKFGSDPDPPRWGVTERTLAALDRLDRPEAWQQIGGLLDLFDALLDMLPAGLSLSHLLYCLISSLPLDKDYAKEMRIEVLRRINVRPTATVRKYSDALRLGWKDLPRQIIAGYQRQRETHLLIDHRFGPVEGRILSHLGPAEESAEQVLRGVYHEAGQILDHGKKKDRRRLWVRFWVRVGKLNDKLRELDEPYLIRQGKDGKGQTTLFLRVLES